MDGGSVPEWLMGADCKSAGYAYAGSNPARPIHASPCSSAVEHTLGKGEVMSSILIMGFLINSPYGRTSFFEPGLFPKARR